MNFYFEHHENLAFTLKHFNLASKTVRYWIAQYKYSGTNGYYTAKDFSLLNLNIVSLNPFSLILLVVGQLARDTFFYHRQSKPDRDSTLKAQIPDIKKAEPNYGYRRVSAKLVGVNHKRVQRLIQEMGLQVRTKKLRKYNSYKGEQSKIVPNLLQQDFSTSKSNEKWLTDITEFRVKDEKFYFSPILDCFNNELIAYTG